MYHSRNQCSIELLMELIMTDIALDFIKLQKVIHRIGAVDSIITDHHRSKQVSIEERDALPSYLTWLGSD